MHEKMMTEFPLHEKIQNRAIEALHVGDCVDVILDCDGGCSPLHRLDLHRK